jgi:hypothetical protein
MPSVSSTIYPTVKNVLNKARSLVNDSYNNGAGRILTDDAPFTLNYFNLAVNHVQFQLANNGVQSFWRDNVILTPITPVEQTSPAVQIYVGYDGYFDGTSNNATPTLPNDLLVPWDVSERPTNSGQVFIKMNQPKVALPSRYQGAFLHEWEWRGDAIWMVGATQSMDLRLRYEAVIPEVQPTDDFSQTVIPIRNGAEALAYRVAYLYDSARGDAEEIEGITEAQAEKAVQLLIDANVRRSQRVSTRRRSFAASRGGNIDQAMYGIIS